MVLYFRTGTHMQIVVVRLRRNAALNSAACPVLVVLVKAAARNRKYGSKDEMAVLGHPYSAQNSLQEFRESGSFESLEVEKVPTAEVNASYPEHRLGGLTYMSDECSCQTDL